MKELRGLLLFAGMAWGSLLGAEPDLVPPTVVTVIPAPDAIVSALGQIEVVFSESVAGVDAADMLVNRVPATNVFATAPGQYVFEFDQPMAGVVTVAWADGHGITDLAVPPNAFAGGSWTLVLDTSSALAGVLINEFMASNSTGLRDEDGDTSDWIELRNTNRVAVELGGWFLTDDAANLPKWRFPSVTLEPDGYLVVFASGKNRTTNVNRLHASFQLSSGGEFLALVNPGTNVVSSFSPAFPPQQANVSYGRDQLSPELTGTMAAPTPGAPNSDAGPGFVPEVRFSMEGGTFVHPFELHLSTTDLAAEIHYTVISGPAPTGVTNVPTLLSRRYTAPIPIASNTQVRARAFKAGHLPGAPRSETYIQLQPNALNFSSDLPILLLDNLGQGAVPTFGDQSAFIAIFDRDGKTGRATLSGRPTVSGRIGLNIRGRGSQGYPKSGFAVEFWDEYGQDKDVEVLGMPAESDWVLYGTLNTDPVHIHNPLAREMSNVLGRKASRTRFVEVFLNTTGGPIRYASPADGNYNGLYVLIEKVKQGDGRVDVASLQAEDTSPELISGGYVFKSDDPPEGDEVFFTGARQQIIMVYPGKRTLAQPQRAAQFNYVRDFFAGFSNALWGANWTNPVSGYTQYIDVDSWIDHAMVSITTFNVDAIRLSGFFYKDRGKPMEMGPVWDCDRSLGSTDGRQFNPRFWRGQGGDGGTDYFNTPGPGPAHHWFPQLFRDIEFWQRYIDRYQVARQGPYSLTNLYAIIDRMIAEITEAQPREQARWGSLAPPRNTNGVGVGTFATEVIWLKTWLASRLDFMDTNFLERPLFNAGPGPVAPGFALTLTAPPKPGTQIYYTLDGSDPRGPEGVLAPKALLYVEAISIHTNTRVIARSYNPGHRNLTGPGNPPLSSPWSGPSRGTFVVQTPPLIVTEIMYHPPSPAAAPGLAGTIDEDYEFLELKNVGLTPLNLAGFRFTNGIEFTFTTTNAVTTLPPGGRVVIVKDRVAFASRYPGVTNVAGEYEGNLANDGNRLALIGPLEEPVLDFRYEDGWYPSTDGPGFSLVVADEHAPLASWRSNSHWRASARWLGSPGAPDAAPPTVAPILVNEVLAASLPPAVDAIELFNPTPDAVNIGGWFLTDDFQQPAKFRIPAGTTIAAGGYVHFTETEFNAPGDPNGFALSRLGDEVFLFSGNGAEITGYFHGFDFGASDPGVTFGRQANGAGDDVFVAQASDTLGLPNAGPRVGPVVISAICSESIAPLFGTNRTENPLHEYLELRNITDAPVPLFDPDNPANTWRISGGVEFTFPPGVVLPPQGSLVVVRFDPELDSYQLKSFRFQSGFASAVPLHGPMTGRLGNEDDRIVLEKPGLPVAPPAPDAGRVPYVRVERVDYSSRAPWPTNGGGGNVVLRRLNLSAYADDPANWTLVPIARPTVELLTWHAGAQLRSNLTFRVAVSGIGPLSLQWRLNGVDIPGATGPQLVLEDYPLLGSGWYDVRVTDQNGSVLSPRIHVSLLVPPVIVLQPQGLFARPGQLATFTVSVTNTATLPITYRWRRGVAMVGAVLVMDAHTTTLTTPPVVASFAGPYNVVVSNVAVGPAAGMVSDNAPLVVVVPPTNLIATAGANAIFRSTVSPGFNNPVWMQWVFNGALLPGQTNATLTVSNAQAANEGIYGLILTNSLRSTAAFPAGLGLAKPITLSAAEWRLEAGFRMNLDGVAYQNYRIEFATNLESEWQILTTLAYTNGLLPIEDGSATNSKWRAYRAVVSP
jgi:hypothetical protein